MYEGQPIQGGKTIRSHMYSVFLSSYRNTSGRLGEREMLWEHERREKKEKNC